MRLTLIVKHVTFVKSRKISVSIALWIRNRFCLISFSIHIHFSVLGLNSDCTLTDSHLNFLMDICRFLDIM